MIQKLCVLLLIAGIFSCTSKTTSKNTVADTDKKAIIQQEITYWQLAKLKNLGNLQNNLAEDYLGYFGTHTLNRQSTVNAFKKSVVYGYKLSDIHTKNLDDNAVIVYYILDRNIVDTTTDLPWATRVASSTVYVKENNKWLAKYYQEMLMPDSN